eukprot:XP_001710058.1 Hypothetical protein GL50803_113810 [Giardia lamblia ATCC 50803]
MGIKSKKQYTETPEVQIIIYSCIGVDIGISKNRLCLRTNRESERVESMKDVQLNAPLAQQHDI